MKSIWRLEIKKKIQITKFFCIPRETRKKERNLVGLEEQDMEVEVQHGGSFKPNSGI
jgi:hypothetical protein